jgi:hypothetical protein
VVSATYPLRPYSLFSRPDLKLLSLLKSEERGPSKVQNRFSGREI